MTPEEELLSHLEGAVIVGGHMDDETGLHINLADGRELIIAGYFELRGEKKRSVH